MTLIRSDKINFKTKNTTRDKEGDFIIIKSSICEEDIIVINVYVPKNRSPKYILKLTELKEKTENLTIIVGDYIS